MKIVLGYEELSWSTLIGLYTVSINIMFKIGVETHKLNYIFEPSWVVMCAWEQFGGHQEARFLDMSPHPISSTKNGTSML